MRFSCPVLSPELLCRVEARWVILAAVLSTSSWAQTNVLTYHNDTLRTGWNVHETKLTVSSVQSGNFTLQHAVALDEQVDAQPLVVTDHRVTGNPHDVVYVVTENDSIFAIDAVTGAIVVSRNLGTPVPQSSVPGQCNNSGPNIGIASTPVISTELQTMWLIAYTYENSTPVYRLHALDLRTLADKVAPVEVSASANLANGATYPFNAYASRQRSALLYVNGAIYGGFGSFCDFSADLSRGWLLGWKADSLTPFAANFLSNKAATSPNNFFVSSIWMSGYGPATLGHNSPIYFTTGNSDPSGTTYSSTLNLSESLVKMSPDLSTVEDYFTPSNVSTLDMTDRDFGSGGAMLLPAGPTVPQGLLVAAGKAGMLFLENTSNLGQFSATTNNVLGTYNIGYCWCGPSYFTGADGAGRVVSSGGRNVNVWKLNTIGTPTLGVESTSQQLVSGQDQGFFTSVSSNGTLPGSAIIWAVSHPNNANPATVTLYAFDASDSATIFSGVAGSWPNTSANANIVPTVANGRVFVVSNKQLSIFGLGSPASTSELNNIADVQTASIAQAANLPLLNPDEHAIYGTVVGLGNGLLTLRKRDGTQVPVDFSSALAQQHVAMPGLGDASLVRGYYKNGILVATFVSHAKPQVALWKPDR